MNTARTKLAPKADGIHCRGCGKPFTKTMKRKQAWCSTECRSKGWLDMSPSAQRAAIRKRDRGVCAHCGLPCNLLQDACWGLFKRNQWVGAVLAKFGRQFAEALERSLLRAERMEQATNWEMDHVHEVVWGGGGGFNADNLQTLCRPCHVEKTAKLAAHRAALRHLGRGLLRVYRMPTLKEERALVRNFLAAWSNCVWAIRKPVWSLGCGLVTAAYQTKRMRPGLSLGDMNP